MNVVARKRQKQFTHLPAGLSVPEVAGLLGCSRRIAARWGKEFSYLFRNLGRTADGRLRTEVFREKIRKMPQGLTIHQIAEKLNLRYGSARALVAEVGYAFKRAVGSGMTCKKVGRDVWPLLDWTQSDRELARQLSVSRSLVTYMRLKLGMPKSSKARPSIRPGEKNDH